MMPSTEDYSEIANVAGDNNLIDAQVELYSPSTEPPQQTAMVRDVVEETYDPNMYKNPRKRFLTKLIVVLVVLVVIGLVVGLIVWATHNHDEHNDDGDKSHHNSTPWETNETSNHETNNSTNNMTHLCRGEGNTYPCNSTTSTPSHTQAPAELNRTCDDFPCSSQTTAMQLVKSASKHTILSNLLQRDANADLMERLLASNLVHLTLFAPTDDSFAALVPPQSYYLRNDTRTWANHLYLLLGTHILDQAYDMTSILQTTSLPTYFPGFSLSVDTGSDGLIENGVAIVTPDIEASNGYIQVPDRVILKFGLRNTLYDFLVADNLAFSQNISKFRTLVQTAGLESLFQENYALGVTLYVPDDAAFDLLDANVSALLFDSNTPDLTFITHLVLYHVLEFNFIGLRPSLEGSLRMMNNVSAWYTNKNRFNATVINDAETIKTFLASNGLFQMINKVLVPPNIGEVLQLASDVTFQYNVASFINLVNQARLGDLFQSVVDGRHLGSISSGGEYLTVFAPLETAFGRLDQNFIKRLSTPAWTLHLQSLCLHHFTVDPFVATEGQRSLTMLSGLNATADVLSASSDLTDFNETIDGVAVESILGSENSVIYATEGIIQFVDNVLLPPWTSNTVVDTLSDLANVSAFLSLVRSSHLDGSLLNGTDNRAFTLLVPNNAAVAKLDFTATTFQELVSRHILRGNKYTSVLSRTVVSLANETLQVQKVGNEMYIGGALILQPNILASNGVIHVINHVL